MYKIMLIDDEPWVIEGMKSFITWEDEGFSIIADAKDPFDALDMIEQLKPDVVLIDIRMPEISGLDVIKSIREKNEDVIFVIISGFAEFSYAQEGMRLGVFEYLLKPVEEAKLIAIVKRLKKTLDARNISNNHKNVELLNKLFLMRTHDEVRSLFQSIGFSMTLPKIRIGFVKAMSPILSLNDQIVEKMDMLYLPMTNNTGFLIINYIDIYSDEQWKNILAKFVNSKQRLGLSKEVVDFSKVYRAFEEAEKAVDNYFIYEEDKVYVYKAPQYSVIQEIGNELTMLIEKGNIELLVIKIGELKKLVWLYELEIEDICLLYNQILSKIFCMVGDVADDIYEYIHTDSLQREFDDLDQVIVQLKDIVSQIIIKKNTAIDIEINTDIKQIITYVTENYSKEVYLKDVSKAFFINPNYLSVIFKKATGKTFSGYLMDLRMTRACELLVTSSYSLEEVCENVGYVDYYNFNKAFKKHVGMSPGRYKRDHMRG